MGKSEISLIHPALSLTVSSIKERATEQTNNLFTLGLKEKEWKSETEWKKESFVFPDS